ncbi:hypothetical protein EYF80_011794 [Liparis tanakae]|uniref:Uncharacterized protein n=1 Tax=Liparis tanakae TaxID=230148 RepID=A0A4Z2IJ45_9TELE|nr:hypothetical protein EYF80_011794 [Liparis tanakae]
MRPGVDSREVGQRAPQRCAGRSDGFACVRFARSVDTSTSECPAARYYSPASGIPAAGLVPTPVSVSAVGKSFSIGRAEGHTGAWRTTSC